MPARAQGPKPGPPGPAFPPELLSGSKMRGRLSAVRRSVWSGPGNSRAAPWPRCEPLRPLPFKSPPGTDNRGDASERRTRTADPPSTPLAHPKPSRTDVLCAPGLAAPRSGTPQPLALLRTAQHRWQGAVGHDCACAERRARSAPRACSEEGLSPPPLFSRSPSALTWGRAW